MADDNYNPLKLSTDGATKTWPEIFNDYIDKAMRECRVWLPVTVLSVTKAGPGTVAQVSVQPTLLRKFPNLPTAVPIPALQNLPVQYPRGSTWGTKYPIAPGDAGVALFCDRSLDVWKSQPAPAPVDPQSLQTHSLSDGVFIPGLYPLLTPEAPQLATAGELDFAFYNGAAQLFLQPQGAFIQGNGTLETFDLLVQTLTQLTTLVTQLQASLAALAVAGATDTTIPATTAAFTAQALLLAPINAALTLLTTGFTALKGVPGA